MAVLGFQLTVFDVFMCCVFTKCTRHLKMFANPFKQMLGMSSTELVMPNKFAVFEKELLFFPWAEKSCEVPNGDIIIVQ